ncbi:phosphoserine phosphatase 1 [Abditibacteriota bacterium]|nr:phosphoserine phosphatase 1 [Abditibacteriota bacterium]
MSRDNVFCGSGLNPELTPEGQEMAESFAAAYSKTQWQAVYTSPLQRAVATAAPLCTALGLSMEKREGLVEIGYGSWEAQTVEKVSQEFHDDYLRWTADPAWNAPTGGETANAVSRRALEVVEDIGRRYLDGNVLIVSHKATIRIALCALMGIDVGRFRFRLACPVGSVSIVEFAEHGPLLQTLANREHQNERLRSLPGT